MEDSEGPREGVPSIVEGGMTKLGFESVGASASTFFDNIELGIGRAENSNRNSDITVKKTHTLKSPSETLFDYRIENG